VSLTTIEAEVNAISNPKNNDGDKAKDIAIDDAEEMSRAMLKAML